MNKENGKSNFKIIIILVLMAISVAALSLSFGYATLNRTVSTTNVLSVSDISFNLTDSVEDISLGEVIPVLDKFGSNNSSFSFSITNNNETDISYIVRLVDATTVSTIDNTNIRYQLTKNAIILGNFNLVGSGVIDTGTLAGGGSNNYSIKIWLDYESNQTNGTWSKVVSVEAGIVNIDSSGANHPTLTDGLIPIYYDNELKIWRKADENNNNANYRWYDYNEQIWANAVTVSNKSRGAYMNANIGTEVKMEDINAMWVWIPRYKYTIFNKDGEEIDEQEVNVTFEQGIKTTGTLVCKNEFNTTNKTSETCDDYVNGAFINGVTSYTHPSFTFNNEEIAGLWVAKFEASADPSSACYATSNTTNCDKNNLNIYIKPGIKSLANIKIKNLQSSFRRMELEDNIYGFSGNGTVVNNDGSITGDNNDLDVHMIKNSEWGAVSLLSHSKYGKYGNVNYSDIDKEIYHNASSDLTGYSMGNSHVSKGSYAYDVDNLGLGASTTGNIYGIYDMKGGKAEYVMMNFQTTLNTFVSDTYSGFVSPYPRSEYYDAYYSDNSITPTKYGDAVKETRWGSEYLIVTGYPYYRGGFNGSYNSSVFSLEYANVWTVSWLGSRPILKISNDVYITKW